MDNARTDGQRQTDAATPRHHGEVEPEDEAAEDATTLKFEGTIGVTDDERGGDPYNRTGRFKRVVR